MDDEIQRMADEYPDVTTVLLAICDIARLSHAHKHGQRIRELLTKLKEAK